MTTSRRRRAARDAAVYGWRSSLEMGEADALERIGHSTWLPTTLVNAFALVAMLFVAATWLVPAITAGVILGWDTTLEGGSARAVHLSGPAWMYGLFGLAFVTIAVSGLPYVVSQTRKGRRPAPVLTLAPGFLKVHTLRDVKHGTSVTKPQFREAPTVFEWRDINEVEPSVDPDDERPTLIVRRTAADRFGVPVRPGDDDEVRIRIRGDARDVPVISYFLAKHRQRRLLGSEESLRLAQRLSNPG